MLSRHYVVYWASLAKKLRSDFWEGPAAAMGFDARANGSWTPCSHGNTSWYQLHSIAKPTPQATLTAGDPHACFEFRLPG